MKRAASPPRASTPRALYAAAPTFSRSSSATPAAAVRRANAPRARQPPLLRLTASRPRARAAPTAPEPVERVDETRGLAAARVDAARAVRGRADVLALFERGAGCRRTPRERSSRRQPPLLRLTASRPRARAAPTAPEPAERVDETRGLAAARVDAERAVRSRAHALALFERCVGDRRTPRKRSSRPPAAPPAADCISISSPRSTICARARRASRRGARPHRRARRNRARCCQPRRHSRAF